LALTKINIGGYAVLAIGLALLKATPSGPMQKTLFALVAVGGLSLPFIIIAPLLHFEWAQLTVVLVVLSMIAAILAAWCSETEQFVSPSLWIRRYLGLWSCGGAGRGTFPRERNHAIRDALYVHLSIQRLREELVVTCLDSFNQS
jgi:hypothetical protein